MSLEKLKLAIKEEKLTVGANETIKKLKMGTISTVFIASDCKPSLKEKIRNYKKQGTIQVIELEVNGTDVGTMCKRQFPISILSY